MTAAFLEEDRLKHEGMVQAAFSPHSPINRRDIFAGRIEQIRASVDAITTAGLHVAIYGERGVGKTSLANILAEAGEVTTLSRVQCDPGDSFTAIIRRCLRSMSLLVRRPRAGFVEGETELKIDIDELLPPGDTRVSPDEIAEVLSTLGTTSFVVLVIDEFDRLKPKDAAPFADLIKALSDRSADATIILVGVAEDIDELIASHASVDRCLRQLRLPRMSDEEIIQIVQRGLRVAGFQPAPRNVERRIVEVAQGFPHYAHLLAQNAARVALDNRRLDITHADVIEGMAVAVDFADQSHRDLYHRAVTGTKKNNLWKEVVLACALAERDERGFFSGRAVQDSLSAILGRTVIQQTVAFHLGKLTEQSKGPLLERIGPERRYRYRFINPLMRPFVLMKAGAEGQALPSAGASGQAIPVNTRSGRPS